MASLDESMQVFILRIWREAREIEGAAPLWRGVILDAVDGEKHYLTGLDELLAFLQACLEKLGAG